MPSETSEAGSVRQTALGKVVPVPLWYGLLCMVAVIVAIGFFGTNPGGRGIVNLPLEVWAVAIIGSFGAHFVRTDRGGADE